MVLVGKVNKDIVLRINRHGQPAVGLCGDDGLLFRVDTMEGPGGEDIGYVGRIERVNVGVIEHIAEDYIPVIASIGADRDGRSHNVNADEAAAAVARALGAYKIMFLTDVPGWLSDPADPASVISETGADEVEAALRRRSAAACGRSSRRAWTRSTAASASRTSSTAACRTRCCSSCSPTPARAPRSGPPRERARADLRALPGRVRVRLGLRAGRRRRRRVPRLPGRHRGLQHRPLPSARGGGGAGAGGAADARLEPVLERADGAAGRAADRRARSAAVVFFSNSGAEANEAAIKLVRKARPRGDVVVFHGAFHGRTYGALSATPQESKQAPFAPLVPGFRAIAPDGRGRPRGGRRAHRGGADGAGARRVRRAPDAGRAAARGARGVRRGRRGARVRRGPDRHGADRHAVGVRADGRGAGRDDARQGPRRRAADRRAGDRRRGWPACSRPGDHGSTFAGGPLACAAANAALDVLDDPALLARVRELGERLARGAARAPARDRRARARADGRDRRRRRRAGARPPRAARAAAGDQRHRPAHAALPPAAGRDRGGGRRGARPARRDCSPNSDFASRRFGTGCHSGIRCSR